ncbi:DUF4230 domain-containing protein [Sediminitomix flava]|uniref:Uncharacterized protein DUF4230 n=1 Tax=Sediminitomix flava TaxID=379075 RepID=A0A315ZA64_SEDFL|nr:DUF4230 domain-containing protein [Sediminitomix flava]PWJ42162.1 uncharacterized protein DUF4230 [Sediminitomix flava]
MKSLKYLFFILLFTSIGIGIKYYFDFKESERLKAEAILLQAKIYDKFVSKSKLVFGEQHYTDIIKYKEPVDWWPDPSIDLHIKGHVNLCIDLSKIEKKDILITNDSIFIQIPNLEICDVVIDHENSSVFNETNTFFSSSNIVTKALTKAKGIIYKKAVSDPLLIKHQSKAKEAIKNFLSLTSEKTIVVEQKNILSKESFLTITE